MQSSTLHSQQYVSDNTRSFKSNFVNHLLPLEVHQQVVEDIGSEWSCYLILYSPHNCKVPFDFLFFDRTRAELVFVVEVGLLDSKEVVRGSGVIAFQPVLQSLLSWPAGPHFTHLPSDFLLSFLSPALWPFIFYRNSAVSSGNCCCANFCCC